MQLRLGVVLLGACVDIGGEESGCVRVGKGVSEVWLGGKSWLFSGLLGAELARVKRFCGFVL